MLSLLGSGMRKALIYKFTSVWFKGFSENLNFIIRTYRRGMFLNRRLGRGCDIGNLGFLNIYLDKT